jgi:hypothetical protein
LGSLNVILYSLTTLVKLLDWQLLIYLLEFIKRKKREFTVFGGNLSSSYFFVRLATFSLSAGLRARLLARLL